MMSFKAESFDDCAEKVSEMKSEANYFFWSASKHPAGASGLSSCLIFKECDTNEFADLTSPGYTYLRCPSNGKLSNIHLILYHYFLNVRFFLIKQFLTMDLVFSGLQKS